jgi:hypothetical protein
MKQIMRLTKVELRRLLMNKKTYLLMVITILIISLGYIDHIRNICGGFFPSNGSSTMNNIVLPFSLGALGGSFIWGISIILDNSRVRKNKAKEMINAFTDEKKASFARLIAYLVIVTINIFLCVIVYLPICYTRMDYLFSYETYAVYSVITILPGILTTLLICDGLYKISENVGVSLLVFFILSVGQFTRPFDLNGFLRWSVPEMSIISDAFGSPGLIRFEIYTRILILTSAITFWFTSGLFIRKYQFGIIKSFFIRIRKPSVIILPVAFAGISVFMAVKQPFVDHAPIVSETEAFVDFSGEEYEAENETEDGAEAGDTEDVTYSGGDGNVVTFSGPDDIEEEDSEPDAEYESRKTTLGFNTILGTVMGTTEINLSKINSDKIPFLIISGYKIKSITLDGKPLKYKTYFEMDDKESVYFGYKTCEIDCNGNRTGNLMIEYEGYPSLSRSIFNGMGYIKADYVGKKCIELRDKKTIGPVFNNLSGPESEIIVNVPSDHIPMNNSNEMQKVKDNGDGTCCWQARADEFALISAAYNSEKISYSKANVFFKYSDKYQDVVKENDLDGAINSVLDYCDERIGKLDIDFSGEELSNINIVQTSAENSGGQCNGEEVYMDESFLSPSNLSESKAGANKNEIFMHEIIHLYWGTSFMTENDDKWSAEGLTVYTNYRLVKEKYGEVYARQYYVDEWKKAVKEMNNNFYHRHPEYLDRLPLNYRVQVEGDDITTKQYCLMPLMLLKAEEKLGGEEAMDEVLQKLYANHLEFLMDGTGCSFQEFLDTAGLTEEDLEIGEDI